MKKRLFFLIPLLLSGLITCNLPDKNEEENLDIDRGDKDVSNISNIMIEEMVKTVPNPVVMSLFLRNGNIMYSSSLLSPVENISNYNNNFKKALNIGVYGTDLIHMNTYEKTSSTLLYLKNVKELAIDLRIEQFFDYNTLTRLSENNKNADSVIFITTSGFEKMNSFLIEQNRSKISALITFGTWIETLYLAVNSPNLSENEDIYIRIGEQKNVINNIYVLLNLFSSDKNVKELIKNVDELKKEFGKITVTYNYVKPVQKEVDGVLVIIDNSTSKTNITEETLNGIRRITNSIRNNIIS